MSYVTAAQDLVEDIKHITGAVEVRVEEIGHNKQKESSWQAEIR